jgi:hypothetical protein
MSDALWKATATVTSAENDELRHLLARYDPRRSFAHRPGDPVWDDAATFDLVLFLDELPPDLLDQIKPLCNSECAPVEHHNGRPFVRYLDLNQFLPFGFEPGTLWTKAREAEAR